MNALNDYSIDQLAEEQSSPQEVEVSFHSTVECGKRRINQVSFFREATAELL